MLDTGARGSLTTFAQRGIGDVFVSWENEAFLAVKEIGADKFEIVVPSISILAEPPVAVVDKVALRRGTADLRPRLPRVPVLEGRPGDRREALLPAARPGGGGQVRQRLPRRSNLVTIADFGGWAAAQKKHFADGGVFDKIYAR